MKVASGLVNCGKKRYSTSLFTDRESFTLIQWSNHAHCAEGLKHYSLYEAKEVLKLKIDSGHEWRPLPVLVKPK